MLSGVYTGVNYLLLVVGNMIDASELVYTYAGNVFEA